MKHIIAVHKPKGPTSHDVIDEVRRVTGIRKVGHAGTLDPLASGVLVVGIGKEATKQLGALSKSVKEYIATITLGKYSSTDDEEGEKTVVPVAEPPREAEVAAVLGKLEGRIDQTPPQYSAVKHQGKPAYHYARKGQVVLLEPRQVEVFSLDMMHYDWPLLTVRAVTGSGVYVRVLARDIGRALSTGGYLSELVRTRVGTFRLEDAVPPDALAPWREQVRKK